MGSVDVSIIIPTYNGGERLRRALDAIRDQVTDLVVEHLVIDSGSADGSAEAARERGFRVLEADARTFNHGETRDRAIAQSKGRVCALVVQDAIPVNEHWLDRLALPLLEDEGAAGSFSRQLPIRAGNPILDERLAGWIAGRDEPRRAQLGARCWEDLTPFERLMLVAFDNVSSCIKRECWMQRHFGRRPFGEDISWSTWAIREGYAIRFHPDSVVEHSHDRSWWHEARRIYCDHRNLHDLLDLETVPDWATARAGRRAALRHYLGILDRSGLSGGELERRRAWARRYAWGEVVAQWLAPKVNRSGPRGLLAMIDRRIRAGI